MSKTNATALALRLAKTYDVDLSTLSGSGSGGTVTARDVLEHRNLTSFSPTSSAQAQEAEGDAAPQRAPRAERRAPVLVLEGDLEGFTRESDLGSFAQSNGLEGFIQRAEGDDAAAPQRAPRIVSPTSSAEAQEAEGDAAPQRAPRAERRALLLALESGEEDDSDSRKPDGETPRWMFWRRRSD